MFPRLYPIVDTAVAGKSGVAPVTVARILLDAGVGILQYRHKGPFSREQFGEAEEMAELCAAAGVRFVINDRADIARLLRAGLHIGQDDLPFEAARQILLPEQPVGFSTHNFEQFQAAPIGASYVAFGPVFATASKDNPDPVVGLGALAEIAAGKRAHQPLVAIGGITLATAREVWAAGADSIAVISALVPEGVTESGIAEIASRWVAASMV